MVRDVRFAHSPGRLDRTYLNSLREFDTVFVLELADGTDGVLAVDIKFHEWAKPETPKPSNRARNLEVANRSHMFVPGATDALLGRSELCLMWLEHLLLLSMLQHASGAWTWGGTSSSIRPGTRTSPLRATTTEPFSSTSRHSPP